MKIQIPYGQNMLDVTIPDDQVIGVRFPKAMPAAADLDRLLERAIASGFEEQGLADKAGPGATACIVVTDRTRSTPLQRIVPLLLGQLNALGVPDDKITIISGGGMHAADSRTDLQKTLGASILDRVEVLINEPDNEAVLVEVGTTGMGTPVELHRRFVEADIKIGVINVNPCMLAGWSGGGKIVQPAVASRRSIYKNHRHFVKPLLELGCASLMGIMPPDNPIRADIEACSAISGIDLIVNTVLNSDRQLVDVFCGDHIEAHRAAVAKMLPNVEVSFPQAAEVMIAGVGDPALEVSLFQGGSRVCGGVDRYLRPGGTLIMVNACEEGVYEGFEHEEYRNWMRQMPPPAEIGRLVADEKMGGEKGCVLFTFSWLLHQMNCRIILVTDGMTESELKEIHLDQAPSANLQQTVDEALSSYTGSPAVAVMPYAGLLLPTLAGREVVLEGRAGSAVAG